MIVATQEELFQILRQRNPSDRYEWQPRPGFNFHKKGDAGQIGQYLERMAEDNGGTITTMMIATDGDRRSSPLYPLFEHDMEVAALNWRHHETRNLIGSLVVVKTIESTDPDKETETIMVRAFPHVSDDGERSYTPVFVAARVPSLQNQIVKRLLSEARAWQKRAKEFAIFSEVTAAIELLPEELPEAE